MRLILLTLVAIGLAGCASDGYYDPNSDVD
jgi:hypothetical protein